MIDVIQNHIFHLYNQCISYVFYVMENGQLGHLYYGASLGKIDETDVAYLAEQNSKSAGTVKYSPTTGNFNLADRAQEYPVEGSSDFKYGAIDVSYQDEPWYLDLKYVSHELKKRKPRELNDPATYSVGEQESETLSVRLQDIEHGIILIEDFSIFGQFGAIVRRQTIENHNQNSIKIENMMSGALDLPDAGYQFLSLSGAWLKERHIKMRNLVQGTVSVSSMKGASGHQHNPFIALARSMALNHGPVYAANLVYSGNFISQVEVDEWDKTRILIGINPHHFGWQLDAGSTFKTPEAIFYYTDRGLNGLIQETNHFTEQHIIDRQWQKRQRPIVFNNWEATYFDFNEQKLLTLADDAKELGMECFVVDDGWFGHRDDDRSSLGNWQEDERKFPNGIANFSEQIHQKGLQFGLWFEPEMVSPDTQLYSEHPDWIVRHPYQRAAIGRGQYVLDFANPAVVDNIYEQMRQIIQTTQLDYIKWDMNRNITEAYSAYLAQNERPQTEFYHRYIQGVYALYQRILTDFPTLLIEGCAGGGGRYDLGILFYSPQIWPSDDSDAVERLSILSGTTLAYPLSSFVNHISAVPNDQVGRNTPLAIRLMLSQFGPLGYELDITKLSELQRSEIRQFIKLYQQNRELLVNGHFQQLLPVSPDSNTVAWCVHNDDYTEMVVGFFRKLAQPNAGVLNYVSIPMLSEQMKYSINDQEIVSGAVLKHRGLREPYQFNGANPDTAQLKGDFQAYSYHIKGLN